MVEYAATKSDVAQCNALKYLDRNNINHENEKKVNEKRIQDFICAIMHLIRFINY